MTDKYYIIKQSFPYLPTKINKVYCPCNLKHLKELLSFFTGTIEVYLYDEKSAKREDLTNQLGNRDFDIYEHKFEKLHTIKIIFTNRHIQNQYFI